ncbi:MAG: GNAT family N-acetyltransferase, partial [Planctomycetota bacterium]
CYPVVVVRGLTPILDGADRFFMGRSSLHEAARELARLLDEQGAPYAAGRIRFFGEYAKLERIAIRKSHRGKNLGHELTNFMISIAEAKGFKKIKIHAEAYLKKFYEQHGFEVVGEKFREVNIDHYVMIRKPPKEQ